jgi:hypothetical protein
MGLFDTAKRTISGSHPAVVAMRKKLESIADNVLPELEKQKEDLDEEYVKTKTIRPPPANAQRRRK